VGRLLAVVLLGSALLAPARAGDVESRIDDLVDSLPGEAEECAFLRALCLAAASSIERAEGTPPSADFLATRQDLFADARVREAVAGAAAIERKHRKRLPCFDDEDCRGILPRPRADP
jgi:hypothetical protein